MRRIAAFIFLGASACIPIADLADAGDAGDGAAPEVPKCPGAFADAVKALPGLLGYWRLDEAPGTTVAADRTGKHPGKYGSSVTQGVPGLLVGDPDLAADFSDQAGSYVDVPAAPDLDLQTFTLGALIEPSAITATDMGQQIVAKSYSYWLQLDAETNDADSPHLEVGFISPPSGDASIDHPISIPFGALAVGAKALVIGTYDGTSVGLSVNGSRPTLVAVQRSIQASNGDLYIGSWDGTSHLQAGVIDEVFVSSAPISATQVADLYLAAQGCADAGD